MKGMFPMKLLLVEDEAKLNESLSILMARRGFDTDTALDGITALDKIRANKYDIIVLDRMLPHLDGLSILKKIRSEGNETPVIFLTAKDSPVDRVAGLEAGADDYLIKPFFTDELLARINVLVRRAGGGTPKENGVIKAGGITLYSLHGQAVINDAKVQLTVKESALLNLLMANKGQVVTKERIMEKIWGYNSETNIANVDLYIYYLRKKLGSEYIKTIRGIGYCFAEDV
jgi:DNA-binding response OmpR family regulator